MAVGDAHVFPGFLTPVLTQLFFPKPPTSFLTRFCRGKRRKYAGKKIRLNRESNSQPQGHETLTLSTEPLGRGSMADSVKCNIRETSSVRCVDCSENVSVRTTENKLFDVWGVVRIAEVGKCYVSIVAWTVEYRKPNVFGT